MSSTTPTVIGELMNNSYGRARRAWKARDLEGYQNLAKLQTELGASYLTLNTDGTQKLSVTLSEMLEFLPKVVPAIQEVTGASISFDNPDVAFHKEALKHFDPSKSDRAPILNSISVSRTNIDDMIDLVGQYDMNVLILASECLKDGKLGPATCVEDILETTKYFTGLLRDRAGVENHRIIVDPGLAPLASDTQGHINLGLDAMRAIRNEGALEGIHISVGLSNFSIGMPGHLRIPMERAYLRLALDAGLDFALANPEKNTQASDRDEALVKSLEGILAEGRQRAGESAEDAGYRQLDELMELWADDEG